MALPHHLGGDVEIADEALREKLAPVSEELRFFFITSTFSLQPAAEKPATAVATEGVHVWATASESGKCVRCWHYRADVGTHRSDDPAKDHPELCGRCVENVCGAGETRRWF